MVRTFGASIIRLKEAYEGAINIVRGKFSDQSALTQRSLFFIELRSLFALEGILGISNSGMPRSSQVWFLGAQR